MKGMEKEKNLFHNVLQREARQKLQEEVRRREVDHKLQKRLQEAEKRERQLREQRAAEAQQKALEFEGKKRKAKQLDEERIKQHAALKGKQMEDLEKKGKKRAELEEEMVELYRENDQKHHRKVLSIKDKKLAEDVEEQRREMNQLMSIEKACTHHYTETPVDEEKKQKGEQSLKAASARLQAKNEVAMRKIIEIRRAQAEAEAKAKREYRKMQNAILRTIVRYKGEDLKNFKRRTSAGPVMSLTKSMSVAEGGLFREPDSERTQKVLKKLERVEEVAEKKSQLMRQQIDERKEKDKIKAQDIEENLTRIQRQKVSPGFGIMLGCEETTIAAEAGRTVPQAATRPAGYRAASVQEERAADKERVREEQSVGEHLRDEPADGPRDHPEQGDRCGRVVCGGKRQCHRPGLSDNKIHNG